MKTIPYDPAKIKLFPNLPRAEPFFQDSSAYKLLTDCRWKYFLRIVLGRVPAEGNSNQLVLDFGSHYHKFRELLEKEGYSKAMTYIISVNLPPTDPKSKWGFLDHQRLVKSCHVAFEHWKVEKQQKKIEVVAVEQPFNIELFPGHFIGGRADQIVKWNGRLWGRDFKTTTKDEPFFVKGIDPNDQAIRYIVGESAVHGQEIQGILFEVMYNTKTVGPKIYTKPSTRNPYQIETWKKAQEFNSRQLKVMREEDIWPMDDGYKCGYCEYHIICRTGNPQSQEGLLKQKFKFQPWDHTKVEQSDG
jgi:hypothetical protein